jgi:preprotein translocase subunit SecD
MSRSLLALGAILLLGCSQVLAQAPAPSGSLIEIRAVSTVPASGFRLKKSTNDNSFYVADTALVSDDDIQEASTDTSALNPGVLLLYVRLKPGAAARLHEFTQRHVGERLALLFNGQLTGTPPIIRNAIAGPTLTITGPPSATSQQFAAAVTARWPSAH